METRLYIELFGNLRVREGRRTTDRFRTQKTGALLAYLACHPNRMHSREVLADMLWPDAASAQVARNNVSVALSSLRNQFEPPSVPPQSVFIADRSNIGIGPAVTTDVGQFDKMLDRAERARDPREKATLLTQAVLLHKGELLPGMYEEWVTPRKEQLAGRFLTAIDELARYHEKEGQLTEAIRYAQRALEAEVTMDESETLASVVRLLNAWRQNAVAPRLLTVQSGHVTFSGGGPGDAYSIAQSVLSDAAAAAATERGNRPPTRRRVPPSGAGGENRHHDLPQTPGPSVTPPTPPMPPVSAPTPAAQQNAAPAIAPSPASLPLPLPVTRFFGRDEEQMRLGWLLRTPSVRLVTLVGPGGAGKTRLALEAAREFTPSDAGAEFGRSYGEELESDLSDHLVCFVPLSELTNAADLPTALAAALHLGDEPKAGDPLARPVAALSRRPSLLILDNAEHILEGVAELVQKLLARLPGLTCLVTSRQRLQMPEEQIFMVGPLPVPPVAEDGATPQDPAVLVAEYPSVALFVDRAQRTRPDFQLNGRNASSVAKLVAALEGIPFAIELAAARAFMLTPHQMVEQMQQAQKRFDLLKQTRRGVSDRHQSLRATLDWSVRLLHPGARELLAHLSIFRGGWTLEAACNIIGSELLLDDLALLADASLVEMRTVTALDDEDEDTMRYCLLETVREYAREILAAEWPEEGEALTLRHAQWCADQAEETEANLRGPRQAFYLEQLARERDNLRAALSWATTVPHPDAGLIGLRIMGAAHRFYLVRGVDEGRRHLDAVLNASSDHPDREIKPFPQLLAKVCNAAGVLALAQGDLASARVHLTKCLALRRALADSQGIAATLNNLAIIETEEGNLDGAIACYEESLELWRRLGEAGLVATVQANLGACALRRQNFAQAQQLLTESLRFAVASSDIRSIASRRFNLGEACLRGGEFAQAERILQDSLRDFLRLGDIRNCALCLLNLGFAAIEQNKLDTATKRIGTGLAWCRANGTTLTPRWQSDVERNIVLIENLLGSETGNLLRSARPSDFPTLNQTLAEILPDTNNNRPRTGNESFLSGI